MSRTILGATRSSLLAVLLFSLSFGLAAHVSARPPARDAAKPAVEQEKSQAATPAAPSGEYVGSETCKTCHEDMPSKGFYKNFEDSPHFVTTLDTKKGPEWHGCEACHGPGKAHVEGGGDKTKIFAFRGASASEVSQRCLGCHQYGEEHSNYARSVHLQNGVACTDCHDPHHAKENQFLLKATQPALCYGCHLDKKQQFTAALPSPGQRRAGEVHRLPQPAWWIPGSSTASHDLARSGLLQVSRRQSRALRV